MQDRFSYGHLPETFRSLENFFFFLIVLCLAHRGASTNLFTLLTSDRTQGSWVRASLGLLPGKDIHPKGGWAQEQAPQGNGHSTKPVSVQEAIQQCSQAHGGTGVFCVGPGVGLDDPDGSLPTQLIPWSCDSSMKWNVSVLSSTHSV